MVFPFPRKELKLFRNRNLYVIRNNFSSNAEKLDLIFFRLSPRGESLAKRRSGEELKVLPLRTPISYVIGVPPPMTEVDSLSPTLGFVPSESPARRAFRSEGGFSEG